MTTRQEQMRIRLLELVVRYPGKDALELKEQGWTPRMHGSIRDAEKDGDIEYRFSASVCGWYVTDKGVLRGKAIQEKHGDQLVVISTSVIF